MNLITESWRLKLLALGLSVLMLGAVAFAQNPPTLRTLTVNAIQYTIPDNLIVLNAPTKTTVTVTGLADSIQSMNANSIVASFDLSKASPGAGVKVNLSVKSLVSGVTPQNPSVPFALTIDTRKSIALTVQVRYPRVAPGWVVTKADAACPNTPCIVNFDGPSQWETKLNAYADFGAPVQGDKTVTPNVPINLEQAGAPLDIASFLKTAPYSSLDPAAVEITIQAKTGTTSKQVVLIDSAPSHGPPAGYRVTGITINPLAVVISGKADALLKITTLSLPAVDLTGHTASFTVPVTILYPVGVTGSFQTARITYSISANPNVPASPSPSPPPSP
jgi:YbbR domain-containing protein